MPNVKWLPMQPVAGRCYGRSSGNDREGVRPSGEGEDWGREAEGVGASSACQILSPLPAASQPPFSPQTCTSWRDAGLRRPIMEREANRGLRGFKSPSPLRSLSSSWHTPFWQGCSRGRRRKRVWGSERPSLTPQNPPQQGSCKPFPQATDLGGEVNSPLPHQVSVLLRSFPFLLLPPSPPSPAFPWLLRIQACPLPPAVTHPTALGCSTSSGIALSLGEEHITTGR